MIVVVSHDAFFQRYGGVSRCVVELMRHLGAQRQGWRAWAGIYGSRFLKALAEENAGSVIGTWRSDAPGRIIAALRNEARFARSIGNGAAMVVHRSYYPVLDLLPRSVPTVVTLHDMYWEAPGVERSLRHRAHSLMKRRALTRADRIVCISQFTCDELHRTWPDLAGKAEVIPHGVSPLASTQPCQVPGSYFLFVGDRAGRKNFEAALGGLAASGLGRHGLICVGGGSFSRAEQALIARMGLAERVTQRAADDRALARDYAEAAALLYPSTYEGFGMPLLEAMLHACPVIAAQSSSLPEVGGDAAIYVAPHDTSAWGAAMRAVVEPVTRARLIADGLRRAAEFSWADVARRYAAVYRTLARSGAAQPSGMVSTNQR